MIDSKWDDAWIDVDLNKSRDELALIVMTFDEARRRNRLMQAMKELVDANHDIIAAILDVKDANSSK